MVIIPKRKNKDFTIEISDMLNRTPLMSIFKVFAVVVFFVFSKKTYSQEKISKDYVITLSNDSIFGKLETSNFYKARNVNIQTKDGKRKYNYTQLKEIKSNGERYLRRKLIKKNREKDTIYIGRFSKPLVEHGEIQAVQINKKTILSKNKTDFYKRQLKYYADDYPLTKNFLKQKNNSDSLVSFIKSYNVFKEKNPKSQCFAEKNLHFKKFFNLQLAINGQSLLIPTYGYFGAELGLNKFVTLSPRLSYVIGAASETDNSPIIYPFAEMCAKVYPLCKRRVKTGRSTFLYSGYNLSFTYMQPFEQNVKTAIRIEIGFKMVAFNKFYLDYYLGDLYFIDYPKHNFWGSTGIGYIF